MAESENSMEYLDTIIVEMDAHHRHCSQISTSTNNKRVKTAAERSKEYRARKKIETLADSDLSSMPHKHPKTAAQRMREYRARKKKETPIANRLKRKKTGAERAREYRTRKKAQIQSAVTTLTWGLVNEGSSIETIDSLIEKIKLQYDNTVSETIESESDCESER